MVANRSIPAWAAGLAVMSAYTSSISYIATPGKAFDENWHPLIFALMLIPVCWAVSRYVVPWYHKTKTISVYAFLEERLGYWARFYAAFSFVLYMIGRMAVILYLASLLLDNFLPWQLNQIIFVVGIITILYTLLGGMEAVIWTDVIQSIIMIGGLMYCGIYLSLEVLSVDASMFNSAYEAGKFSLGGLNLSLNERTIWVMIIYGLTENLRNLIADQNYVQKYVSVSSLKDARRSIWMATWIYLFMTLVFLYIGTALWMYYVPGQAELPASIGKGDEVFPYFIASELPPGLKGLILAAIVAAAMSTMDSALNCSATVINLDFYKRSWSKGSSDRKELTVLRWSTVVWGILGTLFALWMISAKSALDVWWQISGIFGGGILGLFLLALMKIKISTKQGVAAVGVSIIIITWGTFARNLSPNLEWMECHIDPIIIGALGTGGLILVAYLMSSMNQIQSGRYKSN